MTEFNKAGGVAGLVAAGTYIFGFAMLIAVLGPAGYGAAGHDMVAQAKFYAENQTSLYLWNLGIWIINSFALVILALALHAKVSPRSPAFSQVATAFALIWAGLVLGSGMLSNITVGTVGALYATNPEQAGTFLQALSAVEEGLGGGNELAGGVWILVLSLGALRGGTLSKPLNLLGVLIGLSGLSTLIPSLAPVTGAIFGLGFIVWFAWACIQLLMIRH